MKRYCIGDIIVDIDVECERLERLGKPYEVESVGEPNMRVIIPNDMLDEMHKEYHYLTRDEVAYLASGAIFNRRLTAFNGLMLHSSAIEMDGRAYLFSANSGTGKSTHTGLWKKTFGDKVTYINDDKPIIRKIDGKFYVYGTPWSGKTDLNTNIKVPLAAIVFIERGVTNSIEPIDPTKEAVAVPMLEQPPRPRTQKLLEAMLNTADDLLTSTPLFRLRCNISEEAVYTSYNTLKNC